MGEGRGRQLEPCAGEGSRAALRRQLCLQRGREKRDVPPARAGRAPSRRPGSHPDPEDTSPQTCCAHCAANWGWGLLPGERVNYSARSSGERLLPLLLLLPSGPHRPLFMSKCRVKVSLSPPCVMHPCFSCFGLSPGCEDKDGAILVPPCPGLVWSQQPGLTAHPQASAVVPNPSPCSRLRAWLGLRHKGKAAARPRASTKAAGLVHGPSPWENMASKGKYGMERS